MKQINLVCFEDAGLNIDDHFVDINKMVVIGSVAGRQIDGIMLTHYACYLNIVPGIH